MEGDNYHEKVRTMAEEAFRNKSGLEVLTKYIRDLDNFHNMDSVFNKCDRILKRKLEILDNLAGYLQDADDDPLAESDKNQEFKRVMKAMKSVRRSMTKVMTDLAKIIGVTGERGDWRMVWRNQQSHIHPGG